MLSFAWGDAGSLFVAVGKTRRNLAVALLGFAVPLTALLVLRPATPLGVAACWAATTAATGPLVAWLALRELKAGPLWLLGRIAPAAGATAAMTATVLLAQSALAGEPPALAFLAAVAAGAGSYGLVARLVLGRRLPRALTAAAAPARAG